MSSCMKLQGAHSMHTIGLKMCFCHLWWQIGKDIVAAFEEAIGRKGDHIRVAALV
jgi:hypothetical protein